MEFDHLAGYLPHNIGFLENGEVETIIGYKGDAIFITDGHKNGYCQYQEIDTLVLRPMSDIYKTIFVDKHFIPAERLDKELGFNYYSCTENHDVFFKDTDKLPYWVIKRLYEWHFDIFGGIGIWAIDINNIKSNKQDDNESMNFHECSECNIRCNCTTSECSCSCRTES